MNYKKICPDWVRPDKRVNWIFNTTIEGYIYERLKRYNRSRRRDDIRWTNKRIQLSLKYGRPLPF